MGARNVSAVFARWTHVPDPAFRVLVFMALVTYDHADPPVFWDGQEALAVGLGRMIPEEPAESDSSARADAARRQREADIRAVKRCLQVLTGVGVVKVHRRHAPGRHAEYALSLGADSGRGPAAILDAIPVDDDEATRDAARPGHGTPHVPLTGRLASSVVGGKGGETYRTTEEQGKEQHHLTGERHLAGARDAAGKAEESERAAAAHAVLASLPDFGTEYMNRTNTADPMDVRKIAAAITYLTESGIAATHRTPQLRLILGADT